MKSPVHKSVDPDIASSLSADDEVMSRLIAGEEELKIPVFEDYFYSLVMSIVYQQLSYKAAETIFLRLVDRVKGEIRPEILSLLKEEEYRSLGVSRQKAGYILDICRNFNEFPDQFENLHEKNDDEVIKLLTGIKGIGQWTAQMFLMFTLMRPDVFPVGDLGIRKAISGLYGIPLDAPFAEFEDLASRWAPYRSYACHYLWNMHDQ